MENIERVLKENVVIAAMEKAAEIYGEQFTKLSHENQVKFAIVATLQAAARA